MLINSSKDPLEMRNNELDQDSSYVGKNGYKSDSNPCPFQPFAVVR